MSLAAALASVVASIDKTAIRGAEIGVLRGDTSRHLLQTFPHLTLLMVDAWSAVMPDSRYGKSDDSAAMQHWSLHMANEQMAYSATEFAAARRVLLRGDTVSCAQVLADASLDFAFIDADHTYEGVVGDIRAWWPKVREGGILAGHDYGGRKNHEGVWGVDRAVNEFVEGHRLSLQRAPRRIWWVRKGNQPQQSNPTAPDSATAGAVIRVLFGNLDECPKLKREVQQALQRSWDRTSVEYYVAGRGNADFLRNTDKTSVL